MYELLVLRAGCADRGGSFRSDGLGSWGRDSWVRVVVPTFLAGRLRFLEMAWPRPRVGAAPRRPETARWATFLAVALLGGLAISESEMSSSESRASSDT